MCFIVSKSHPEPKVADKDIKCYKLVVPSKYADKPWFIAQDAIKPVYYSEYREYRYVEGEQYRLPGFICTLHVREDGYLAGDLFYSDTKRIEEGFHSYSTFSVFRGPSRFKENDVILSVVEFVIPQGSIYYYNEVDRTYVSDRIKCVSGLSPMQYLWLSITDFFK